MTTVTVLPLEAIALVFLARSGKDIECRDIALSALSTPGAKEIAQKLIESGQSRSVAGVKRR